MDTPSTRLPQIKPRFFLRRWVDRLAIACIRWARGRPVSEANYQLARAMAMAMLPFVVFGASCLAGAFHPSAWSTWGLLGAVLIWPVRWALGPWVRTPDEDTVRALLPSQYQLIQDFSSPAKFDGIVAWALEDPYFDTRHLLACMEGDDYTIFHGGPFTGVNALDLFDGLVGQRVIAIRQGQMLEATTPKQGQTSATGRRL